MNVNKTAPPSFKRNLSGMVFGNGSLLALDAPPMLNNGKWEWLCQCQIHDVEPKYFRITKLENGVIKSCGCHGGRRKLPKSNDDLIGKQIGYVKVLNKTRIKDNRPELLVRCVVCGHEKWVRAENLRMHVGISCNCIPRLLRRKIGNYFVLDTRGRKNDEGLPEFLCATESGDEIWVLVEELLRIIANERLSIKKGERYKA